MIEDPFAPLTPPCSGPVLTEADFIDGAALVIAMRAASFAAARHAGMLGKGEPAPPYINHLIDVALLVARASGGNDADLVAAALLHDTVEKAGVAPAEIAALFGPEVAHLVAEVTDDPDLPPAAQKQAQVDQAPHLSTRAKMLKLADKISNLTAQATEPADRWPPERRRTRLAWARAVAEGCRGVSWMLDQAFDEAAAAFARGGSPEDEGSTASQTKDEPSSTPRQRP